MIEEVYDVGRGSSFLVATKDGWLYEYGTTDDSLIADCAGDCETRVAMLSRAVDPHGLSIRYYYDSIGDVGRAYLVGIEYALDHANESTAPRPWNETETMPHPAAVGSFTRVVLRYEHAGVERDQWNGGRRIQSNSRLAEIEQLVDGEIIRRHTLQYLEGNAGPVLQKVVEDADFDAGGPQASRELVSFEYSPDGENWDDWEAVVQGMPCATVLQEADEDGNRLDWLDIDGQGTPRCTDTNDTGFSELILSDPDTGTVLSELLDLDGDGHLDRLEWWEDDPSGLICPVGEPCLTWRRKQDFSMSWGFPERIDLPGVVPGFFTPPRHSVVDEDLVFRLDRDLGGFVDLTGDGLPDYVMTAGTTWAVFRNLGDGEFDAQQLWTGPGPDLGAHLTHRLGPGPWPIDNRATWRGLVDFNGDGLLDYLNASPGNGQECRDGQPGATTCSWELALGTGSGFEFTSMIDVGWHGEEFQLSWGPVFHGVPSGAVGSVGQLDNDVGGIGHRLVDLDGDGLLDLVADSGVDLAYAFNDGGAGFHPWTTLPHTSANVDWLRSATPWVIASDEREARAQDMDGDGRADWFRAMPTTMEFLRQVDSSGKQVLPPHLLTRMNWPSGAWVEFDYALFNEGAPNPQGDALGTSWNLAGVTWSRADRGDLIINYNAPVRAHGRQIYRQVDVAYADGSHTLTHYHGGTGEDEWPLMAEPIAIQRFAPNGDLLSDVRPAPGLVSVGDHLQYDYQQTVRMTEGTSETRFDYEEVEVDLATGLVTRKETTGDGLNSRGTSYEWGSQPHPHLAGWDMWLLDAHEDLVDGLPVPGTRVEYSYNATGDRTVVDRELVGGSAPGWYATNYTVDAWGYVTGVSDPMGDTTSLFWGPDYRELTIQRDSGSHLHDQWLALHPWFDVVERVQRLNGLAVIEQEERVFDAFGRPIERWVSEPDDPSALWLAEQTTYQLDGAGPLWVEQEQFSSSSGMSSQSRVWLDEFGRLEQQYNQRESAGPRPGWPGTRWVA